MHSRDFRSKGFALPLTVIAISALLVVMIGVMSLTGSDQKISEKFAESYRAELAAESAAAEAGSLLRAVMSNDDYLVIKREPNVSANGSVLPRAYYYAAKPEPDPKVDYTSEPKFRLQPLFSGLEALPAATLSDLRAQNERETGPDSNRAVKLATIPLPEDTTDGGVLNPEHLDKDNLTSIPLQPWQHETIVAWRNVHSDPGDRSSDIVGRYAYWIEDLEGYVDGFIAGSQDSLGKHERTDKKSPAPGLPTLPQEEDEIGGRDEVKQLVDGKPALASMALHTLFDQENEDENNFSQDNTLVDLRKRKLSSESVHLDLLTGRDSIGVTRTVTAGQRTADISAAPIAAKPSDDQRLFLADEAGRKLEENVVLNIQPYQEQPRIPYLKGIDGELRGKRQLNLNVLLQEESDNFIEKVAEQIDRALPEFAKERQGGFRENYTETLAAGLKDYADVGSTPSTISGAHRGVEGMQINEYALQIRNLGPEAQGGRNYIAVESEVFVELWNLSNQSIRGDFSVSFEVGPVHVNGTPETRLDDPLNMEDSLTMPQLIQAGESDGRSLYYFAPREIVLGPNEHKLVTFGPVKHLLSPPLAEPGRQSLKVPQDNTSGYHALWNGQLFDRSKGGQIRFAPNAGTGFLREGQLQTYSYFPGHSYGLDTRPGGFVNNMGDSRMSYYIADSQKFNAYPINWTPGRRNVLLSQWTKSGRSAKEVIYAKVWPSAWPDGGHDTPFGRVNGQPADRTIRASSELFNRNVPDYEETEIQQLAPMVLSNSGHFISETELGHIFDPIMWDVDAGEKEIENWEDIDSSADPSGVYGGGNTLRIGRPEHSRFTKKSVQATRLLDLFHTGQIYGTKAEMRGPTIRRAGHLNVNTATYEALRVALAGNLQSDPQIKRQTNQIDTQNSQARRVRSLTLGPEGDQAAGALAAHIIKHRPYASVSQLGDRIGGEETPFGNKESFAAGRQIQWNDAATEELFARIYNSGTVRSRNFRIYTIGQSLDKRGKVLSTVRKMLKVFVDPGERSADGTIIPDQVQVRVINESVY